MERRQRLSRDNAQASGWGLLEPMLEVLHERGQGGGDGGLHRVQVHLRSGAGGRPRQHVTAGTPATTSRGTSWASPLWDGCSPWPCGSAQSPVTSMRSMVMTEDQSGPRRGIGRPGAWGGAHEASGQGLVGGRQGNPTLVSVVIPM